MKFRKKKKGSSLIFAVIIFMVVITVSTAMLSMVAGNIKARAVESKRVQNLYGAESGLDAAYNVIAKTVDNADKYAYNMVENFKTEVDNMSYDDYKNNKNNKNNKDTTVEVEIEKYKEYLYLLNADIDFRKNVSNESYKEDKNKINLLINHVFRYYFKQYIDGLDDDKENLISNIRGEVIDDVQNGKYSESYGSSNTKYISYNGANITFNKDDKKLIWKDDSGQYRIEGKDLVEEYHYEKEKQSDGTEKYVLKTRTSNIESEEYPVNKYSVIDLVSNFKETSSVGENQRTIEAKYTLNIPNYKDVTFEKSLESGMDELPGLTVGGNLTINGDMDVHGDIMVEGGTESVDTLENKYNGGISIDNSESHNVNFYNNVFCRKTFNVKDNSIVNVGKNLYAGNVYINSTNNNGGSYLGVKGDSDIVSFDENSKIPSYNERGTQSKDSKVILNNDFEMNSYNALVDINNFYGINDISLNNDDTDKQSQKSSSIIINNNHKDERNSSLVIENEAYIRGVAYINTKDDGNRAGYQTGESVAVKGNYIAYSIPLNPKEKFDYYDPLQLLQDDNFENKKNHFLNYWNNCSDEEKKMLDNGGVFFRDIDKVHSIGNIVYAEKNNKNEWESKVKAADDSNTDNSINNTISTQKNDFAKNIYSLNIPGENKGEGKEYKQITDYDDMDKISSVISHPITVDGNEGKGIIVVKSGDDLPGNSFKGIVIADGDDLNIDKNYKIEGDLIVLGNLTVNKDVKFTLKYDRDLTKNIQNKNLSICKSIFNDNYGQDEEIYDDGIETTDSNSTDFIKKGLWKIKIDQGRFLI